MRSCDEYRVLIYDYIDNELDSELLEEFKQHIEECSLCKLELMEISETINLVKAVPEVDIPDSFNTNLHEKLIREKERQDHKNSFFILKSKYLKVAGAVAAVLIMTFLSKGFLLKDVKKLQSNNSISQVTASEPEKQAAKKIAPEQSENFSLKRSIVNGSGSSTPTEGTITPTAADNSSINAKRETGSTAGSAKGNLGDVPKAKSTSDTILNSGKTMGNLVDKYIKRNEISVKANETEIKEIEEGLISTGALPYIKPIHNAAVLYSMSDETKQSSSQKTVSYLVSDKSYKKALEIINSTMGNTVSVKENVAVNIEEEISALKAQVEELDKRLEEYKKDDRNSIQVKSTEEDLNKIQSELDKLNSNEALIIIDIVLEN